MTGRPASHRVIVTRRIPHPGRGFTQGLLVEGDVVWESTGGYGRSALRRYRIGADSPETTQALPDHLFGEGICRAGDHIWQLTWRERIALRWDHDGMRYEEIPYNRDGWGICAVDGRGVYTSDGTSELVRRDPDTLAPLDVIHVRAAGQRVRGLNDLTFSGGQIWANVAGTVMLAGIDPCSGEVTGVVDAGKAAERHLGDPQAIMNGIAALPRGRSDGGGDDSDGGGDDSDGGGDDRVDPGDGTGAEFLLTGKGWRRIRHVRLVSRRGDPPMDRLLGGQSR
jgi:glutaminyl-peptide cyclotransferase